MSDVDVRDEAVDELPPAPPPKNDGGYSPRPADDVRSVSRERGTEVKRSRTRSPPRRSPDDRSPPREVYRVYVGNLPFSVTTRELEDMFDRCGRVTDSKVVMNRETFRSKGYGFVTFDSERSRRRAVYELDGMKIQGRPISVTNAHDKSAGPPPRGPRDAAPRSSRGSALKNRITLGGLPSSMNWKDLKDFLREVGDVEYVVQKDNGDWFADFRTESEMRHAVRYLDGKDYKGARLFAYLESSGGRGPPPPLSRSRSPYDASRYDRRDDYDRRPPRDVDRYDRRDIRDYDRPPPPRSGDPYDRPPPPRDDPRYRDSRDITTPPPRDLDDRGGRYLGDRSRGGSYRDDPVPPPVEYRGRDRDEPPPYPRDGGRYDNRSMYRDDDLPPPRAPPVARYADSVDRAPPVRSRYSDEYDSRRGPPDDYPPRDREYSRKNDGYGRPQSRAPLPPPPDSDRDRYRDYSY